MMEKYLECSKEVAVAIEKGLPLVALESTIISHGMPYPENVETALNCERIIRENGAVPATIAILNGRLKVGLSNEEIDFLGKEGVKIQKTSRRDIAYNVMRKINGATTVSATMFIAALAGIKVFATGGIGGVHRGAENTMDISADLEELAMTDVAVISAGAKSILDLGLTLEYLETKGVPVIGYKTEVLPAFYSETSDFKVNFRIDTPEDIARLIKTKYDLGLKGGILIANPVPGKDSMDKTLIDNAIQEAITEMNELGIKGKETTPYLLSKIASITKGRSLASNIALVYNNCKLGAEISVQLTKISS
ncbi:MAG: pseudouridine-5'-phosphate glycosidase [Bacteroidetes bacterium]|nr:pseudouridine-5'-phosphate glycosidase [Bacteroidota bacterium]